MKEKEKKARALGLSSGGLDSILSALVLRRQGIYVEWVSFETPFFLSDKAQAAAVRYGIPLNVVDITESYLKMLKSPRCGYGQHMNPCLDCHALMFQEAGKVMIASGFDFMFSGEVLGQRPMSQTKSSLRYVEKHSGFEGRVLRPLSAKLLSETIAERCGLVKRQRLYDISGRSRKRQLQLAEQFHVTEFPAPAGGCLLTDKGFSARLKDLFAQGGETENDLHLLRYGRHFRLAPSVKLVVGRTQVENDRILCYRNTGNQAVLKVERFPGPIGVIPDTAPEKLILLAASILAGYSKVPDGHPAHVRVAGASARRTVSVRPLPPATAGRMLITQ
jgi:hypothetical protein